MRKSDAEKSIHPTGRVPGIRATDRCRASAADARRRATEAIQEARVALDNAEAAAKEGRDTPPSFEIACWWLKIAALDRKEARSHGEGKCRCEATHGEAT
jgi:hypothetical protein